VIELVIAEFRGAQTAYLARAALGRLQSQLLLRDENVVVVTLDADGRVSLSESLGLSDPHMRETPGTFWNTLANLLVTSGASAGSDREAALSKLATIGIEARYTRCFDRRWPSGSSALMLLIDGPTMRKHVLGVLNGFHGRVERCTLKGDDRKAWLRTLSAA
jgi:uncharacterized membrane protein